MLHCSDMRWTILSMTAGASIDFIARQTSHDSGAFCISRDISIPAQARAFCADPFVDLRVGPDFPALLHSSF
jgi:hypothetical protein